MDTSGKFDCRLGNPGKPGNMDKLSKPGILDNSSKPDKLRHGR